MKPKTIRIKVSLFQFLMVRLKDGYGCSFDDVLKISIPYGAIKSYQVKKKTAHSIVISIPYGAIKRKLQG